MERQKAARGKRRRKAPRAPSPELLTDIFTRNAYTRVPDLAKREDQTSRHYKKGYEVRFVVKTEDELEALRRLLQKAGFSPAKPFQKAKQIVQPVYGRRGVEHFQQLRAQMGPAGTADEETGAGSDPTLHVPKAVGIQGG